MLPETHIECNRINNLTEKIDKNNKRREGCFTFVKYIHNFLVLKINDNGMNLSLSDANKYIQYINQWFKKYCSITDVVSIHKNIYQPLAEETIKIKNLSNNLLYKYAIQYTPIRKFIEKERFSFTEHADKIYSSSNSTNYKSCKVINYCAGNNSVTVVTTELQSYPNNYYRIGNIYTINANSIAHIKTKQSFKDFLLNSTTTKEFVEKYGEKTLIDLKIISKSHTGAIIIDYKKIQGLIMLRANKELLQLMLLSLVRPLLTTKYNNIPIKLLHLKEIFPKKDLFNLYGLINYSYKYDNYYWIAPNNNIIFPNDTDLANIFLCKSKAILTLHNLFGVIDSYYYTSKERLKQTEINLQILALYNNNVSKVNLNNTIKLLWKQLNKMYNKGVYVDTQLLTAVNIRNTCYLTIGKTYTCNHIINKQTKVVNIMANDFTTRKYSFKRFKIIN